MEMYKLNVNKGEKSSNLIFKLKNRRTKINVKIIL